MTARINNIWKHFDINGNLIQNNVPEVDIEKEYNIKISEIGDHYPSNEHWDYNLKSLDKREYNIYKESFDF